MGRTIARLVAVAVATWAAPLAAQDTAGRYKLSMEADCARIGGEGILRIEDNVLHGAESRCRMTAPVDVRGMDATLYDMICTGEGSAWQERAMVMRGADDGLILVWDGYAFAYPACPVPAARPKRRPVDIVSR